MMEPTERWPSISTRVRTWPRFLKFSALTPAWPLLTLAWVVAGLMLPAKAGSVLTNSAMFGVAWEAISSVPTTVRGVGAS
jgi:hypothetical protein